MRLLFTLLLTFGCVTSYHSKATDKPLIALADFAKDVAYQNVKLSPKGDYISFIAKQDDKNALFILDASTFKLSHAVAFKANGQVGDYEWVNDERVVMEKQYLRGWSSQPRYKGELFGVNANGSKSKYLVGFKGERQVGSNLRKATPLEGISYILDPLHDDPKHMLIYHIPWTGTNEPTTKVYRVNVENGKRTLRARSPENMARFLTDHQGNVRGASASKDGISTQIYIRDEDGTTWKMLKLDGAFRTIELLTFDKSGEQVYIQASQKGEPEGIFKLELSSGKATKIYQDDTVSPKALWVSEYDKELYAIEVDNGYPTYIFPDEGSIKAKRLKNIIRVLQGNQVHLVSNTQDGKKSIFFASSDINAGQYFLYDSKTSQLQQLFSAREWLKPDLMSQTKSITFQSRDKLTIHGYLTLPVGSKDKDLPLVVMPHGGPHYTRDWWEFNPEVQMLASRGIAVLQVNFRGSGGYGDNFQAAGYQQWGGKIQHDIIDGVKYVVSQGYASKDNICIMGASFGGYSALQSAIVAPDMFKCAIGVVGIYDLPLMFEEGDIALRQSGTNYLTQVLGKDTSKLKAFSPSYNTMKLKAPVLIVHGGEDDRAPIEQAESLIKALKAAKHPHEYMLLDDEGHGFYKPKHRAQYYETVMAFLEEHMKL
ncbi:Dipeptidyl aminopeptidase BIII [Pseudoalteromonas holothuriae]|uniref:Dipeptidyl aminopeptidase BIII n=1 Tax=Pseudoalteromonas holothuriae TaxID=2963714 RepID=A0A9W4R4F4_9GAMM|nr:MULTISPECIES: S9 family peptidase [unclassified Pseudoalteromonas]CAH9065730.1 Dipeptidyl aminopeptidase BIII [Pseudoalteromonas sp. CIP111951]CAH9066386.1 Dipeptidyl aminopeptidase BIII [Pseudoalteromonas sp. CIP111854]